MTLRTVTAVLWFLAVSTAGGALSAFTSVPSVIGVVAGLVVAGVVWWDPADKLWRPRADAAVRRRRVADIKRMSAKRMSPTEPAGATRQETESALG